MECCCSQYNAAWLRHWCGKHRVVHTSSAVKCEKHGTVPILSAVAVSVTLHGWDMAGCRFGKHRTVPFAWLAGTRLEATGAESIGLSSIPSAVAASHSADQQSAWAPTQWPIAHRSPNGETNLPVLRLRNSLEHTSQCIF